MEESSPGLNEAQKKFIKLTVQESLIALSSTKIVAELKTKIASGEMDICIAANQNVINKLVHKDRTQNHIINDCPLHVIDKITESFRKLKGISLETDTEFESILEKINGLRRDLAEVFAELKIGNIAAVSAVQEAQQGRDQVNARLTRLEKRDKQVLSCPPHTIEPRR